MSRLNNWFDRAARSLPWRENPTPYRVWVSEVMLQQTQVRVVLPYFRRWMAHFPSVEALAKAPIEEIIKVWEGLGYYSRARSLKKGAQFIVAKYGQAFPSTREELLAIPGIGPYTSAAILSFAFKKRALALDGNVIRVLSRYFAFNEEVTKESSKRVLEERGDILLDDKKPWKSSEALIELGALVCTKSAPKCEQCPLSDSCLAFARGQAERFPIRAQRKAPTLLKRAVVVAHCRGDILVSHNTSKGLMEGLFEFPYASYKKDPEKAALSLIDNLDVLEVSVLKEQKHGFTRYHARLTPFLVEVKEKNDGLWMPLEVLKTKPFSAGHRRILQEVMRSASLAI